MSFWTKFLGLFGPTKRETPATQPRVKFVEGTEWTCQYCGTTIAIVRRDIRYGDLAKSSEWDIKDRGFWDRRHCGGPLMRYSDRALTQIHTPTGWAG